MTAPRGGEFIPKRDWLRIECKKCGPEYIRMQRTGMQSYACINCWSKNVTRTWGAIWVADDGQLYFLAEAAAP